MKRHAWAMCVGLVVTPLAAMSYVLPQLTRAAAFRYAESAWLSFLSTQQKHGDAERESVRA